MSLVLALPAAVTPVAAAAKAADQSSPSSRRGKSEEPRFGGAPSRRPVKADDRTRRPNNSCCVDHTSGVVVDPPRHDGAGLDLVDPLGGLLFELQLLVALVGR